MSDPEPYLQEAAKAMQTSFFKRKPDYDTAAMAYENAAKALQYRKQFKETVETFMKASEAHNGADNVYFAAKAVENAANVMVSGLKDPIGGSVLYYRASELYRRNNNIERAIDMLEKAGKVVVDAGSSLNLAQNSGNSGIEGTHPLEVAIKYYREACELYELEDKLRLGIETFRKVISLYLKNGQLKEAIDFSYHYNENVLLKCDGKHLTMRGFLTTIIMLLAFGDQVQAAKVHEKYIGLSGTWASSDEGRVAGDLLDAYDKREQAILEAAVNKQMIGFLDNEIIKLARSLRVPGAPVQTQAAIPSQPDSNVNQLGPVMAEDDYTDLL